MKQVLTRRIPVLLGCLLAVAGFCAGVWWFAFTAALDQLEERGRADLALAADRLTNQLQRFRELAVFMADHPLLTDRLDGRAGRGAADALLQEMADKTGSYALVLADDAGRVVAAAGPGPATLDDAPEFRRAMSGALGLGRQVDAVTGRRVFSYAAPVFAPSGAVAGAVIVGVDLGGLEANWPSSAAAVFFSDAAGVVYVANRSELVLTARVPGAPAAAARGRFPDFAVRRIDGHDLWRLDGGRYLPARALHLTQPLPVIGMTGEILIGLWPAAKLALLQAAVVAALCLAFGAILFRAAERLQIEAAANAALEARVAERTGELSQANRDLIREIGERKEAEAALKRAQADLVQAGKLSALGKISAGISHELNQPLMAIRSLAENGTVLLDRGKAGAAGENFGRIGEMARRMGRIIKNLRAFSRQETADLRDVDLGAVVEAALEIAAPRLDRDGIALDWRPPAAPVVVRGGEVRLQQVVLNLVTNAADAMAASATKRLEIAIAPGNPVALSVRDTGPGLAEPERIFEPFYSTKEVGQAEGMGLGLSISYGLVQSFGGAIRGRNHPGGGAVFTVELAPAGLERAA